LTPKRNNFDPNNKSFTQKVENFDLLEQAVEESWQLVPSIRSVYISAVD